MTVADIMTRDVISVRPDTPIRDVAKLFLAHGISGVPVVDADGSLAGIISEADLIIREANLHFPSYLQILDTFIIFGDRKRYDEEVRKVLASTAEQVMTTEVFTTRPDAELGEVARVMFEEKINRLPVLDGDRVVGIISRHDIIRQMVEEMEAPA